MAPARIALAAALVVVATALQVTVPAQLGLPGATPDVVLLVVVALALAHGPGFGLATGFSAGLLLDVVPPAAHEIGRWALVLTLVGYLAGLARLDTRRSVVVPLIVVAAASAGSLLAYAGLGALIGDPSVTWARVDELMPTAVLYDVVLSAFVLPGVLTLVQRAEPDQVAFP